MALETKPSETSNPENTKAEAVRRVAAIRRLSTGDVREAFFTSQGDSLVATEPAPTTFTLEALVFHHCGESVPALLVLRRTTLGAHCIMQG